MKNLYYQGFIPNTTFYRDSSSNMEYNVRLNGGLNTISLIEAHSIKPPLYSLNLFKGILFVVITPP